MYVKPEILEDKAKEILSRRKSFVSIMVRKTTVPLKRIELIYLPYYLVEILFIRKAKEQKATISVDGLLGNTMFFVPDGLNYMPKVSQLSCDFVLSPGEARKIASDQYRWLLLEHGLRTRDRPSIKKIIKIKKIFYPYWVGYFQKSKSYDFKAIDAVSGEIQGVKMRKVFLKAFRQLLKGKEHGHID